MKLFVCAIAVVCCFTSLGCDLSTSPAKTTAVVVFTDQLTYTAVPVSGSENAQYSFKIVLRTVNVGSEPIYLARCTPTAPSPAYAVIDNTTGGASAYSPVGTCPTHDKQFLLESQDQREDTLTITGPMRTDVQGPIGAMSGPMHLIITLQTCAGDNSCILGFVPSNNFNVIQAQ